MNEFYLDGTLFRNGEAVRNHDPNKPFVETAAEEDIYQPTWPQLVRHEPELGKLLVAFDLFTDNDGDVSPDDVWLARRHGGFKQSMSRMVGRKAETHDPFLVTDWAYDVAFREFQRVLDRRQAQWNQRQDELEDELDY